METSHRVLIVEDVPADAELNEREIRKVLTPCVFKRVETEEDFLKALDEFNPDLIISDYKMPAFDGLTALKSTMERTPLTPFILVTGSMDEDTAVDCMKAGATDYVVKEHLKKLGPAVLRALEEKEICRERLAALESLKESEEKLNAMLLSISDHMSMMDNDLNIIWANDIAKKMFGEDVIGKKCYEAYHGRKKPCEPYPCLTLKAFRDGKVHEHETQVIDKEGNVVYFHCIANAALRDKEGTPTGVLEISRDVTERRKAEDRLEYLAYYDSLTGLPNRNLFLKRLDREIAAAKNSSNSIAVLITDINKFRSICDIYGPEVADGVLKEVAEGLSASIRKGDIAAHLGNDEFGIICSGVSGADSIIMLEKIIKDLSYPVKIEGEEIILTFSAGISLYPHDGENASELLKSAGLALSTAKKEGMKTCRFYSKEMNVEASERMLLEKQLAKAVKDKEFILHYQPYWDITTKKMVGMEALVRWQSKDKGLVPPGKFIPVLEDTGMIIEVGEWVLREAMRQVKEWQNKGHPVVPVSVNMSLVQFRQKDLAEMIAKMMGECSYYPLLLTLEITESAFMQDIEFTKSALTGMKEIGCSVSIDDFGTGYSSLAYLKRFPVDNLKIDISFIREMTEDPDSASIVMAIINMANALNLKTIAEGIETEKQWKFLRLLRCDMGQGFYLGKPLPAEDLEKLLIGGANDKQAKT